MCLNDVENDCHFVFCCPSQWEPHSTLFSIMKETHDWVAHSHVKHLSWPDERWGTEIFIRINFRLVFSYELHLFKGAHNLKVHITYNVITDVLVLYGCYWNILYIIFTHIIFHVWYSAVFFNLVWDVPNVWQLTIQMPLFQMESGSSSFGKKSSSTEKVMCGCTLCGLSGANRGRTGFLKAQIFSDWTDKDTSATERAQKKGAQRSEEETQFT